MADVFTKEKRSEVMARIRGRGNERTEIAFMSLLRRNGIAGWRRHRPIPLCALQKRPARGRRPMVRPDFVFPAIKLAVFIDGCFWHGCPLHGVQPSTNEQFWSDKIQGNIRRDRRVARSLRRESWSVLRIWEHELRNDDRVMGRLRRAITRCESR
jgi:DNA mismatch endonuclease (patch repair protein)